MTTDQTPTPTAADVLRHAANRCGVEQPQLRAALEAQTTAVAKAKRERHGIHARAFAELGILDDYLDLAPEDLMMAVGRAISIIPTTSAYARIFGWIYGPTQMRVVSLSPVMLAPDFGMEGLLASDFDEMRRQAAALGIGQMPPAPAAPDADKLRRVLDGIRRPLSPDSGLPYTALANFDPEAYLRDEKSLDAVRDLVTAWHERRLLFVRGIGAREQPDPDDDPRTFADGFDAAVAACLHELRVALGDDDATDEVEAPGGASQGLSAALLDLPFVMEARVEQKWDNPHPGAPSDQPPRIRCTVATWDGEITTEQAYEVAQVIYDNTRNAPSAGPHAVGITTADGRTMAIRFAVSAGSVRR